MEPNEQGGVFLYSGGGGQLSESRISKAGCGNCVGDLCKSWGTGVAGGVPSHSGGVGYGGVSHTSNLIRSLLYPIRELYQFGT
jgi:hypothetical protein